MTIEYTLKGLACPNCAAKIETAVKSLPGVSSASCSAMNSSLVLEADASIEGKITVDIDKIVQKYEPGVKVTPKEKSVGSKTVWMDKDSIIQIIQFISGLAIFVSALLMGGSPAQFYLYIVSYAILGWNVLYKAVRNILSGQFFDECFLMSVATIGAFIVGEYAEAVAVMLFYLIGEFLQDLAVRKSKKSITDLMGIRPDYASIISNGDITRVAPETVQPGDFIIVKPGERIPLDGIITEGISTLDTKALTGESLPRTVFPSDEVLSGSVNINGVITIKVTKEYGESTAAKIIDLVENAGSKKAPTENFITTFSRYYTPAVVGAALLLAILPPLLFGGIWDEWIHRALVFLVISCPCALVVSVPLGFFGGIGCASKNGVLVKGGNYIEALNSLDIVVFDKTGTLTKGVFKVTGIYPENGIDKERLLEYAAKAESFSNHPIALSVLKSYNGDIDKNGISEYIEFPGYGVKIKSDGDTVLAGNNKLMENEKIPFTESNELGTCVYVSVNGKYYGHIIISDEIKPDSRVAIAGLKKLGVSKTVMLTGDSSAIAVNTAKELMLDEVYAQLLPGQKVEILEKLETMKHPKGKLAFVGDGINDAPVLARADIGVAMGGLGSDAAIEAADIVIMTDEPSKLVTAVGIAKATKRIVWQNIIFALVIKSVFIVLGAFGVSGMWEAVFADIGVTLIAVLNSLRTLRSA